MIYSGSGPNYESFYNGGFSSMDPDNGNYVGWKIPAGQLGQSMNPTTANQLKETMTTLKSGVQEVEVQMLGMQDVDQQIPKDHFREMRGLLKLSGARASLHGPVLDPAGFGQQGADENTRAETQRRFIDAVEKAYELDPHGNIHVVFHASNGTPGPVYGLDESKKPGEEGRKKLIQDFAIDKKTGRPSPIKMEPKYYPSDPRSLHPEDLEKSGRILSFEDSLASINEGEWENKMTELAQFGKFAQETFGSAPSVLEAQGLDKFAYAGERNFQNIETGEVIEGDPTLLSNYNKMRSADIFLENVRLNFTGAFDKAFEFGTPEQRKELKELAERYSAQQKELQKMGNWVMAPVQKMQLLSNAIEELKGITTIGRPDPNDPTKPDFNYGAPKQYVSAQEYALEKSSDTFSNVAMEAYEKFGDKMPTIAIENYAPGTAFNQAEDLKELVHKARNEFADKLVEKKGVDRSRAEKIAKDRIGATWDVGHMNFHKRLGWTDEDLALETAKIAPDVKHLHLTDNFGFSDSHLVPGMGNVPFKKHLEELEKAGVLNKVRKVVEAGGYIQQISQQSAHGPTMSAFGSSIYGAKMESYWKTGSDIRGNYFGGYGMLNPSQHHNLYGAGFTTLPMEVGGNIPGGGSRFSGNSMA